MLQPGRKIFILFDMNSINAEQNDFQRKRQFTSSFCSELVCTEVHNPCFAGQGAIGNVNL